MFFSLPETIFSTCGAENGWFEVFILFSGVLAVGGGIHGFRWSVLAFRHLPHLWEVPTAYSAVSSDDSVVSLLQALRLGSSRDVTLCDLGFVGSVRLTFFGSTTCRPVGFFVFFLLGKTL